MSASSALPIAAKQGPAGLSIDDAQLAETTKDLFARRLDSIHRHTDKMFVWIMALQWLLGILLAVWNSPRTWSGAQSQIHPHVLEAIFLGGAIATFAIASTLHRPGSVATRHIVAVCQMLYSALLIDVTNGRIETHFHVFGSLAFLAFYRDWPVLITASAVVALDHMLRGYFMPYSVYGVLTASPWRWVEHAAWVAFEDTFLIWGIARILREMRETARQHGVLVTTDTTLRAISVERERLLSELERADRDIVTGLWNHRALQRRVSEEITAARQADRHLTFALLDLENFKYFNDAYGHSAGDDMLREVAGALSACCRTNDTVARYGGDEFAVLVATSDPTEAEEAMQRIKDRLEKVGYRPPGEDQTIPIGITLGMAMYPLEATSRQELIEKADSRLRRAKLHDERHPDIEPLRQSLSLSVEGFPMLDALVAAVDNKDRYTRHHSEDVMSYSMDIARQLGMDEETVRQVQIAALLHDVGKIGVPDFVLRKPGKLTHAEFEAIKQHPLVGGVIVAAVPGLEHTLDAIRHHHERWDGKGYPHGLAGEQTPLMARLMAVADAYSAMTTDRPYRKGMSHDVALKILSEGAGSQWDPKCVEAFLQTRRQLGKAPSSRLRPAA